MDRPEPGLIRWSPNPTRDSFLHINVQHRIVQTYEPTGHAQRGRFDYRKVAKHDDLPPLTAYDWSPSHPGLVAVGTSTGVVNLLRVDDGSNAYQELNLKMSRACHAVAFNTDGKLAVALDRVRSDNCLYVWDVSRLSTLDPSRPGFPADAEPSSEPAYRLEPSVSVSSVKFFEDNPSVLVVGIKGQGLRIHDLREQGNASAIHFATKCCNNLAIDYADQNYFASSALDQPGIMVWDRRATHRQDASSTYLDTIDRDGMPWGGALRLDRAVEMEADPVLMDNKNSFIRSIRFCRDHRGQLAVLSRTGQLRILSTRHEFIESESRVAGSPELLEVSKSHEMDPLYGEPSHRNDKIVSFDWITLRSPVVQPRLLVLRASGALEVLEKPSFTSEYPFKLIPWQPPHRGKDDESSYHEMMELEPLQARNLLGPLLAEKALTNITLFGPERANVNALVKKTMQRAVSKEELMTERSSEEIDLPDSISQTSPVAAKLTAIRKALRDRSLAASAASGVVPTTSPSPQLQRHEQLLTETKAVSQLSSRAQYILDHAMLLRAREGYLFNFQRNQEVVADDIWLQDVWAWVAGAEDAASDGGMMAHPMDLGYLGVHTIWTNDLGSKAQMRLSDGSPTPDRAEWERCLNSINKKLGLPKYDGVETQWPHHRELCLAICNWGRSSSLGAGRTSSASNSPKDETFHTMTAAHALFRGDTDGAVQVLMKASVDHPELLFVSLALQLIGKRDFSKLNFDEKVASKQDPFLRAISSIIATGEWTKIANQKSLPLRDRVFVAMRNLSDDDLSAWLQRETTLATQEGDISGIVLTGITDGLVDILALYVEKFYDFQTAALLTAICAPRFIDDIRTAAFRSTYRWYLNRYHDFYLRAKFDMESTKRSKHHGRPTLEGPGRQIALRCVYCDTEAALSAAHTGSSRGGGGGGGGASTQMPRFMGGPPMGRGPGGEGRNAFTDKMAAAGLACPSCKRHLPRCCTCNEVVGMVRSDQAQVAKAASDPDAKRAGMFPTFCLQCQHVLHLDHARDWFARHQECPAPECRCKCNFRANPELNYR